MHVIVCTLIHLALSKLSTVVNLFSTEMTNKSFNIIRLLTGKVMMIDGAVCEAEDGANSEQKEVAILPFKSHPNPKDVSGVLFISTSECWNATLCCNSSGIVIWYIFSV